MIHSVSPRISFRIVAFSIIAFLGTTVSADISVTLEIVRADDNSFLSSVTQTELDAMAQQTVDTTSPDSHGKVRFSGPLLEDVLKQEVGGDLEKSTPITLTALNDYVAHTTVGVLSVAEAIVATRRNGVRLSIRDRGPFRLILPLSDRPELDNEDYHRLLVWHLSHITIGN